MEQSSTVLTQSLALSLQEHWWPAGSPQREVAREVPATRLSHGNVGIEIPPGTVFQAHPHSAQTPDGARPCDFSSERGFLGATPSLEHMAMAA
jgi:hypothetical protein